MIFLEGSLEQGTVGGKNALFWISCCGTKGVHEHQCWDTSGQKYVSMSVQAI